MNWLIYIPAKKAEYKRETEIFYYLVSFLLNAQNTQS